MTLSKKNSRTITVDDRVYRWAVAPDSGFINVVVQCESASGQRLVVNVGGYDDPEDDTQHRSITAALVRQIILAAVESGWQPTTPGGELYLHWNGEGLSRSDGSVSGE